MSKYRIDSHKLIYHPEKVAMWRLSGDIDAPIYMEVSPAGCCNHRCLFCALDFMGYQRGLLAANHLINFLKNVSGKGLKSVMFAGEGEPFLHPNFKEIVQKTSNHLDVSITTNGVLFNDPESIIPYCKWIKVSINSGNAENYAKIHRCKISDFERVIKNLRKAIEYRNWSDSKCTIGAQVVLLPENKDYIFQLAQLSRDIGLDYLVVKAHSQHPLSKNKLDIDYHQMKYLYKTFVQYSTSSFKAIWRADSINNPERNYKECNALPFWAYLDTRGNLWSCSNYLGVKGYDYGNIYEKSFDEIWHGRKQPEIDLDNCRDNCRMDECNEYLWELKNPQEHVNFI